MLELLLSSLFVIVTELAGSLFTRQMRRFMMADALIMATVATVMIVGLVFIRGIDFFGVAVLLVVALIAGWVMHRVLLEKLRPPDEQ